jgi:hypothetical protein
MQDVSEFFWQLMHLILTLDDDALLDTIEYRAMYLSIEANTGYRIHIRALAKDPEQVEEIKLIPMEEIRIEGPYLVFDTLDDLMFGLRDMFDRLDDDRAAYLQQVIKKMRLYIEIDRDMLWIEKRLTRMGSEMEVDEGYGGSVESGGVGAGDASP